MNLRNLWLGAATTATLAAFSACQPDKTLTVTNVDQPDVTRAFATADGIEAILRGGFSQILGATHATTAAIWPAALVLSFENYGSVANFGMNLRASIPRIPIDNNRGNPTATESFRDFQQLSLRGRTLANAIAALDRLRAANGSLGSPAQDLRGRAFGFYALALANGEMALMYDSVAVSTHTLASIDIPPLVAYQDAMAIALQQLDTAVALANAARTATGLNGFPLPQDWLRTTTQPTSIDDFIKIVRSQKARFRAGVARSPTERAAVDWTAVVNDAAAGITTDVTLDLDNGKGWGVSWLSQSMVFGGWHEMTPYIIGMADTSSGYATWLSVDRGQRQQFTIFTPDRRFPQGKDRAEQFANSPAATAVLPSVYFRNRQLGDDTPGDAWGTSPYDFIRYRNYRQSSSVGPWHWFTRSENDMLRAEGLIRLGREAEAVPLINRTRTANGLAAYPAASTAATPAPLQGAGANTCVPRTPTAAGGALECGSLFEGMKWEKRIETIFSGYAQWLVDSRGWGDLPVGSPTMWPVPFQEMDARREPYYNSLTGDAKWQAATNTYGFGVGAR
jgi:hypothetical protein